MTARAQRTAFALQCQALKPGRLSPPAQWPGPPRGAGSMSLGWRGNAREAPGGRLSLAPYWEEHHRAALEAAA